MSISPLLLPQGLEIEVLFDHLRPLCWGAADILLAYARGDEPPYGFPKALSVEDGGEGPVTAADLAVNEWLLDGLTKYFPMADWCLLSEETAKTQLEDGKPLAAEWLWILDPLDGTKDFLQGTGEYAVHLALVNGHSSVLGVVLLPERDELWIGAQGLGAWCENRTGEKSPVVFSNRRDLNQLILVASRNHRDRRLEQLLGGMSLGSMKSVGSVGCKVATILRGETDLYISLSGKTAPKDWDMAAPEAVLKASGGTFSHANGLSLQYNTGDIRQKGCLIASHGFSHKEICNQALKVLDSIDSSS